MTLRKKFSDWYKPSKGPVLSGLIAAVLGAIVLLLGGTGVFGLYDNLFFQQICIELAFTLFSISGTVLIIDKLNQAKANEAVLQSLTRDMAGRDNALSVRAARELRAMQEYGNGYLSGQDFSGADLSGAPLHGLVAIHTRFIGSNLANADLSGSNLSYAIFNKADLSQANLEKVDLQNAHFVEAILSSADIAGANLQGANLSSAILTNSDLRNVDLRKADLSGADLTNSQTLGAKLGGAKINHKTKLGKIAIPTQRDPNGDLVWPNDTIL